MDIEVKLKISVPLSPWCGNCSRQEADMYNRLYCSLFGVFLEHRDEKVLKCRRCYMALYDHIEKGKN